MAGPSSRGIDLSFLNQDVQVQLARSRDILSQVEVLRQTLPKITDPDVRAKVEQAVRSLLEIAENLSANAAATSSFAISSTGKGA
jgi:hypothetical protein